MDPQMYITGKHCKTTIKKWVTPSGSSNYSTCSDDPIEDVNFNENNMHTSTQSVILAGQMSLEESLGFNVPSFDFNDLSCSENILDQNLDVIVENDDVFVNCNDDNNFYLSENDTTQYIPLESISKLEMMKSDAAKLSIEQERLITIMEESEVATNSVVKNSKSINVESTTGEYLVDMITHKKYEQINDCNKNVTKNVLFASKDSIINNNENYKKTNEMKLKGQKKIPNPPVRKNKCFAENKNINRKYDCHNTTESFVKWERLCQNSENLNSRRSFSYSELSCLTECYGGDDECSTSFKTLDDTNISNYSIDTVGNKSNLQRKFLLHRSKSCDTLPKGEKHLPHIVYDFLKTLSKAIDYLKKQTVVCTCEHCTSNRKHSNKGINKTETNSIKITNEQKVVKEVKHVSKVMPLKIVTNERALSPELLSKNSSESTKKLTPKSSSQLFQTLNKLSPKSSIQSFQNVKSPRPSNLTPTMSVKRLYSWHKEIKSPVGEYIRGKSPSPFKNSTTTKKE